MERRHSYPLLQRNETEKVFLIKCEILYIRQESCLVDIISKLKLYDENICGYRLDDLAISMH